MINIYKTQSRKYFELQLNYTFMFEDHVKNQRGMSHLSYFTQVLNVSGILDFFYIAVITNKKVIFIVHT
eukprot:GAHX01004061.1.p1 GENE.GAHX01004061.1~~GAHX01004061.1.p1  ORF type:complete len:69 (-),score=5.22 GAHX01004061.1:43-249(-)